MALALTHPPKCKGYSSALIHGEDPSIGSPSLPLRHPSQVSPSAFMWNELVAIPLASTAVREVGQSSKEPRLWSPERVSVLESGPLVCEVLGPIPRHQEGRKEGTEGLEQGSEGGKIQSCQTHILSPQPWSSLWNQPLSFLIIVLIFLSFIVLKLSLLTELLRFTIPLLAASHAHNSNTTPITSVPTSLRKDPNAPAFQHGPSLTQLCGSGPPVVFKPKQKVNKLLAYQAIKSQD